MSDLHANGPEALVVALPVVPHVPDGKGRAAVLPPEIEAIGVGIVTVVPERSEVGADTVPLHVHVLVFIEGGKFLTVAHFQRVIRFSVDEAADVKFIAVSFRFH